MVGHIAALQSSGTASSGGTTLKLEPGTEVQAKVVESRPDNVLRLAVGKETIEVKASAPLPKGTEVTVKVSGDAKQPQIQITPSVQSSGNGAPQSAAAPRTAPSPASVPPAKPTAQLPDAARPQASPQASTAQTPTQGVPAPSARPIQVPLLNVNLQGAANDASIPNQVPRSAGSPLAQGAGTPVAGGPTPGAGSTPSSPSAPSSQAPSAAQTPAPGGATSVTGAAPQQSANAPAATPSGASPIPTHQTAAQNPASAASSTPATTPANGANALPSGGGHTPPSVLATSSVPTPAGSAQQGLPNGAAVSSGAAQVSSTPSGAPQTGALPSSAQAAPPTPGAGAQAVSASPTGTAPASPAGGVISGQAPTTASPAGQPPQVGGAAPAANPATAQAGPATAQVQTGSAAPPLAGRTVPQGALPAASSSGAGAQTGLASASGQSVAVPGNASVNSGAPAVPTGTVASGTSSAMKIRAQIAGKIETAYPQSFSGGVSASAAATGRPHVAQPLAEIAAKLTPALESQQASLSGVFGQISSLSAASSVGKVSLPEPLQRVMQQILGMRLGNGGAPGGNDVANAVRTSGLLAENSQANAAKTGAGDLKVLLGQMRGLLEGLGVKSLPAKPLTQPPLPSVRNMPAGQAQNASAASTDALEEGEDPKILLTRLMRETDSAMSRIRLTQMVSRGLGGDEPTTQQASQARPMDVVMDLPLAVGQETAVLQMQIGRDPEHDSGEDGEDKAWRLRFGLDLTATGPLEAAVSLRGGGTFVSLWVEREDTHRNLGAQHETIEAAFADAGLDLQELRLIRGLPIRAKSAAGARVDRQS
ncbi:flagellar hook-length control protein FliK [Roseibium polysiphoniae]|uniref:Flagellar hook-length control protein FliK n=1 Tax=Roseibium polysiphoniae TaxID=2571221 RepID=A0A944GSS8_9HYPH|nr:flagellar hook-length control protein FliK [Roseibium polysiphoniae]MBS8259896.1 flagellar hook-length control protein FliK [Roseibium polysiphoniae]